MAMTTVKVPADNEVYQVVNTLIADHHPHLEDSHIQILFRTGNNWTSKGKEVNAKAKVLTDEMRRTYGNDIHITLNQHKWENVLTAEQKTYVLDELLSSIGVKEDGDGEVKYHDDGRPQLKTLTHDFEGFSSVINRHGLVMEETKRFVKAMATAEQLTINDFFKDDEQSKKVIEGRFGALQEIEEGQKQAAAAGN